MTITVIVPTYKRPEYLERCLKSLENQSRRADCLLIVMAGDDDISRDIAMKSRQRGFPILILNAPVGGVRTALNLAFDNCTTDIMVITDDDAEAYPQWLSLIEKCFDNDSTVAGVGGRDELQYSNRPELTNPSATDCIGKLTATGMMYGNHHRPPSSDLLEVDCLKGVNMSLRRKALGEIRIDDGLRGKFAQVAFEIILCFQLRARGWKILFGKQLSTRHWVAPRVAAEDTRAAPFLQAAADSIYNTTYAIVSHAPLLRSLLYISRSILIGSRAQPGLIGAFFLIVTGDLQAWNRFSHQLIPQLQGFIAGLANWTRNSPRLFFSWPRPGKYASQS